MASKIPDKNLAKAVTFSIFEKELQRAGLTLKDIAYHEVMANDFRPIAELTSEERQRRIEANERRINFKKALREEEAKPSEEITAEEAERRQKQLSQYLSEIGVTEERIKINQQVYVPLGWDLRRMRAAIPEASRSAGESSSLVVPQDHVYVSTNISTAGGKIKTEYVSAVDQSLNRVGVDLSLGGYPVVGFGGGKWRQEAEPAPEVEKAIRSSLVDQMDAEVWQQSQGTKHERAIEQVILQRRDLQ